MRMLPFDPESDLIDGGMPPPPNLVDQMQRQILDNPPDFGTPEVEPSPDRAPGADPDEWLMLDDYQQLMDKAAWIPRTRSSVSACVPTRQSSRAISMLRARS